jgi:hypothetical protein
VSVRGPLGGSRPARALLGALAAALALVVGAPGARAEDLDASARARADLAFSEWRLSALDGILAGATSALDREPLLVRDAFWRPVAPGALPPREDEGDSLSHRRAAWLRARFAARTDAPRDPYPVPRAGEEEPYPRITALVLDRVRRETRGAADLETGSPLAEAAWASALVADRRTAYDGFPADPAASARLASATARNRVLGLVAVGVLLVGWAFAYRAAGRSRTAVA